MRIQNKKKPHINVLVLAKNSGIGGVVSCTKSLCDGLNNKHIKTIIAINPGEGEKKMLENYNKVLVGFGTKNILKIFKNYKIISKIIREYEINIIQCQNRIPCIYAMIYCLFHKKVKYIWVNHLVPIPTSFLYRKSTFYGSCAVTDCIMGKDMLINKLRIPSDKVKVINLGVEVSHFKKICIGEQINLKKRLGIGDERIILLYGRLSENKGHFFLLNSLLKCKQSLKNVKFIFPGENEEYKKKIVDFAKENQMANNLIFPGFINGKEILSIVDLMILPSKHESFGISNIEAFSMGVPVIRTISGGYEDMKDMCIGIEYGDEYALSGVIDEFLEQPDKFVKLGYYAKNECRRFSIDKMTNEYIELYKNILGIKK